MILRRVIAHFRKQEWTAIAIDFLIVVVGVFVGLQVNNWNAARVERNQERDYLTRLHEDFIGSVTGQARDIAFLDQQLSDQATVLKSLDACAVAPADAAAFQRGVNTLGYINPPRLVRRTIDEMAAAGKTDVIRNDAIKAQLAAIVALNEWRAYSYEPSGRTTEHYRYIVEEQVRYDLTRTFPDPFMKDFVAVNFDIMRLCNNPQTSSAVSAISYLTRERQNAYRPLLDAYRAFLPLLEQELRERWNAAPTTKETP